MHVFAKGVYMHDVEVPIAGVITCHNDITGIFMPKLLIYCYSGTCNERSKQQTPTLKRTEG